MGTIEENWKIIGILNFLTPEGMRKKSWKIYLVVKNLPT